MGSTTKHGAMASVAPGNGLSAGDVAALQGPIANVFMNGVSSTVLRKIFGKVLAGQRVRLLVFGDSTTAGAGAGTNSAGTLGFVGARKYSWCSQLAALLTSAGIPAFNEARMGDQRVDNETYTAYDPQVTVSAGMARIGGSYLGGQVFRSTAVGNTYAFQPVVICDRYDVFTSGISGGIFNLDVGGTSVGSITTATTNVLQKNTITVPRGTGKLTITTASAVISDVLGIIPSDSTVGGVDIIQGGRSGGLMSTFAGITPSYYPSAPGLHAAIGAELGILQLTINDAAAVTDPAAYAASLATVAGAFATQGTPLILMSGIPSGTSSTQQATLTPLLATLSAFAQSTGRIYMDQNARCISGADVAANGWRYDANHATAPYYADEARWIAETLLRIARS